MKTILLLFGGESPEHEVSVMSAQNILAAIDTNMYEVLLGYIDLDGSWWLVQDVRVFEDANRYPAIVPLLGQKAIRVDDKAVALDVVFPVLHGANGEDGTVQALAKLLHVPVVGCGVTASAVCIDKVLAKQIVASNGVSVVPYEIYESGAPLPKYEDVAAKFGETLFIKPARLGSSVGVSRVTSAEEFTAALDVALKLDNKILIEQSITGRELEVAIIGGKQPRASVVGEIIPDREFYNYESKYDSSSESALQIPAQLPDEISKLICEQALRIFMALGCQGLARVDFFFDEASGTIYLNEVNTMPGFTNISMYPKLCEASGSSYKELVAELITLAA